MLVFALEAPERVMEWAIETKSLGGHFELELTDQICGAFFWLITMYPSLRLIVYATPAVSV